MMRIPFLLSILIFSGFIGLCQSSYRFKADIVMKERKIDSSFQYNKGKVFFDKNINKVIYKMSFPLKEIFVSIDTLLYRLVDNKQVSVVGNPLKPEYSIYYFLLNNDISDFGLKKSNFKAASVEKVDDLILAKWIPPPGSISILGKILITTKNKRLNSVLIYSSKGDLLNRQIYKNYQNVNGVEIPTEILSVTYFGAYKKYQIIEFQNVLINEPGNDMDYNVNISLNKQ
jgi:hypothetical protein